ncbi:hypothetical protein PoMZ_08540 [Pyricularia oryzae]|uniref:Uncharacterized protein n=1 Tax=Pyricularia oryzae TaxID=318829 RepID=A0A4V1C6Z3_PYROR|nr:hypothetical protein PoMZ_08540 [Pyricularia oryzae]
MPHYAACRYKSKDMRLLAARPIFRCGIGYHQFCPGPCSIVSATVQYKICSSADGRKNATDSSAHGQQRQNVTPVPSRHPQNGPVTSTRRFFVNGSYELNTPQNTAKKLRIRQWFTEENLRKPSEQPEWLTKMGVLNHAQHGRRQIAPERSQPGLNRANRGDRVGNPRRTP